MPAKHKIATKVDVIQRVADVAQLILQGKTRSDVLVRTCEKYGIGERQSKTYYKRAKDLIAKDVKDGLGQDKATGIGARLDNYRRLKARQLNIEEQLENTPTDGINLTYALIAVTRELGGILRDISTLEGHYLDTAAAEQDFTLVVNLPPAVAVPPIDEDETATDE